MAGLVPADRLAGQQVPDKDSACATEGQVIDQRSDKVTGNDERERAPTIEGPNTEMAHAKPVAQEGKIDKDDLPEQISLRQQWR